MTDYAAAPERWKALKARDTLERRRMIDENQSSIFSFLYSQVGNTHDAEELTQETFFRALRAIHQVDDPRRFHAWLLRIAVNLANDFFKRKKREAGTQSLEAFGTSPDGAQGYDPPSIGPSPEEQAIKNLALAKLKQCLANLDEESSQLIELRYFEDLSWGEVGEALGIPISTARSRHAKAMERLRQILISEPDASN